MFFYECYEISKDTFCYKTPLMNASENTFQKNIWKITETTDQSNKLAWKWLILKETG